jgi:hypothetical protein
VRGLEGGRRGSELVDALGELGSDVPKDRKIGS